MLEEAGVDGKQENVGLHQERKSVSGIQMHTKTRHTGNQHVLVIVDQ